MSDQVDMLSRVASGDGTKERNQSTGRRGGPPGCRVSNKDGVDRRGRSPGMSSGSCARAETQERSPTCAAGVEIRAPPLVLLFIPAMDTATLSLGQAGGRGSVACRRTARWWVPARPEAVINRESMRPSSSSTVGASRWRRTRPPVPET